MISTTYSNIVLKRMTASGKIFTKSQVKKALEFCILLTSKNI